MKRIQVKMNLAEFFFLFFDIAGNRAMFRFKRQGWCLNTTESVLDSFPFSGTKTIAFRKLMRALRL